MRLAMFAVEKQSPRLGALLQHHVLDLSAAAGVASPAYFASSMAFLEAGDEALAHASRLLTTPAPSALHPLEGVRLCAPVPRPGKIIAVGLNYRDHSLEQGIEPPAAPLFFAKFSTSVTGPFDPIVIPSGDP